MMSMEASGVLVMGTLLLQHHAGFQGILHAQGSLCGSWSSSDLSGTLMSTETAPLPCPPGSVHPPCYSLASSPILNVSSTLKIQNLTPNLTIPISS